VRVDDAAAVDALRAAGVTVEGKAGNLLTVRVPRERVGALSSVAGVRGVSRAHRLSLCNDSARYYSHVDAAHTGEGFSQAYKGSGVIVGLIDTGVDVNHINFCNASGKTRVKAVYWPVGSGGTVPVVDGDTLPGSCWESAATIALLTADNTKATHGTHVLGSAAGSYAGNDWYGVAPEADLVVCGIPEDDLTDANVGNCMRYICDYARRAGKPCVINMSLGDFVGSHDGTSPICELIDELAGEGCIFVLAAGNDGALKVHAEASVTGVGDTARVMLRNRYGGTYYSGGVSSWSDGAQTHRLRVAMVNRTSGVTLWTSPWVDLLPTDSVLELSSDADSLLLKYYKGDISVGSELATNGRYHTLVEFTGRATSSAYVMSLQYVCDQEVALSCWSSTYTNFLTTSVAGYTSGTSDGSISDMATTDNCISVGSYCSRSRMTTKSGSTRTFSSTPTEIASYSSYGPDARGVRRPDVCAPGCWLVSSGSRYDSVSIVGKTNIAPSAAVNDVEYYYYPNSGTSMATPVVTGAVALWLQADSKLTAADVRKILETTSYSDDYVTGGNAERWGFGKLDVAAGLRYILERSTAVAERDVCAEVVTVDYVDMFGHVSASPFAGVNVVRKHLSDGSVMCEKRIF